MCIKRLDLYHEEEYLRHLGKKIELSGREHSNLLYMNYFMRITHKTYYPDHNIDKSEVGLCFISFVSISIKHKFHRKSQCNVTISSCILPFEHC